MLKLGIIGDPLDHSLSPALHRFFMRALSVEGTYDPFPIQANDLGPRLALFQQEGFRGVNVTIPHKVTVMEWVDHLGEEARLVQAVNTLVFEEGGRIEGHNTDIAGFADSLPSAVKASLPDTPAIILGAGGACRAVLAALIQHQAAAITLAVRNPDKALETLNLGRKLVRHYEADTVLGLADLQDLKSMDGFRLIVNTTPIGLPHGGANETPVSPRLLRTLPEGAYVYDLVYGKKPTRLVKESTGAGFEAQDGLRMLVRQGAVSFGLWSGQGVPAEMAEAALDHLRETLA